MIITINYNKHSTGSQHFHGYLETMAEYDQGNCKIMCNAGGKYRQCGLQTDRVNEYKDYNRDSFSILGSPSSHSCVSHIIF